MKKIFIFALIVVSISSCSPEKRLGRLLKKNPHLIKSDTVMVVDCTFTSSVHKDSVFSIHTIFKHKDTIIIQKDRLTQKIFTYRDSIYISGECAADTIIKTVPRYITKIVSKPMVPWWWWLVGGLSVTLFLYMEYRRKRG